MSLSGIAPMPILHQPMANLVLRKQFGRSVRVSRTGDMIVNHCIYVHNSVCFECSGCV